MYSVKVENFKGEVITLTQNESNYQVISIIGLNPPKAQINTTAGANLDGARFNSSRLATRNIVITLKLNGDVETNRQNLLKFFPTKQWCKFFYTNANRNVFIEGYVETVEVDLFSNAEQMQVSIICPQPYFKSVDEILTDLSSVTAAFSFPFAINESEPIPFSTYETDNVTNIYNDSDSETGMTIVISFLDAVSEVVIQNVDTGDNITLDYSFLENDVVTINTRAGEKSISLLREGVKTNIFSALQSGSTFLQLSIGDNNFRYLADDGDNNANVNVSVTVNTLYRGV